MNSEDDGSLRLGPRLTRIEDSLVRILAKLETVVSRQELETLRLRVDSLDRDGTRLSQSLTHRVTEMDHELNVLRERSVTRDAVETDRAMLRRLVFGTAGAIIAQSGVLAFLFARAIGLIH